MENKHNAYDLAQMQSLPLEAKIRMTKARIRAWYEHFDGQVYTSFSGGKDSTVLKHIIDSMYDDVPAVFVNTGLEYPEIQLFVKSIKEGKHTCFNSDVVILRPEMRFDEVIKKYGYPVASKEVAKMVRESRRAIARGDTEYYALQKLQGRRLQKNGEPSRFNCEKWGFLLDADFLVSEQCCGVMKKKPAMHYEKETGRKPFLGVMASESRMRKEIWLMYGCNAFDKERPTSQPMAFWTDQDVLEYIVKYDVPYASVYGSIKEEGELDGQMYLDGFHGKLVTTGVDRTGCIFCMFGCQGDKLGANMDKNRFQLLKETHPNQYAYCMKPIEEGGLGIRHVLEYIGLPWE